MGENRTHQKENFCFWRCLAYHKIDPKPEDKRNIRILMKSLFNDYYNYVHCKDETKIKNHTIDIKKYGGVKYVAYDKEYTDEALGNEEYDKKNDEIDLIEKRFKININVYTNDEPELLQIDRRSLCRVITNR